MLFYYIQDVYQKNKLGQIKDRHDPRNKHQRKSKRSKRQQSWGTLLGERKRNKFSGTKEHLDWFKIDLNAAKTIINYKRTKN